MRKISRLTFDHCWSVSEVNGIGPNWYVDATFLKEMAKKGPLGIPTLEDRLLQLACSKLLNAIFESDFLDNSYGYRLRMGAPDAVNDLRFNLQFGPYGYVVEADIMGFFNPMDHDWLMRMLSERVDDAPFLNLIP